MGDLEIYQRENSNLRRLVLKLAAHVPAEILADVRTALTQPLEDGGVLGNATEDEREAARQLSKALTRLLDRLDQAAEAPEDRFDSLAGSACADAIPTVTTGLNLEMMRRAAEAATSGPYVVFADQGRAHSVMPAGRPGDVCVVWDGVNPNGDAAHIATWCPANALAVLDAWKADRERADAALNRAVLAETQRDRAFGVMRDKAEECGRQAARVEAERDDAEARADAAERDRDEAAEESHNTLLAEMARADAAEAARDAAIEARVRTVADDVVMTERWQECAADRDALRTLYQATFSREQAALAEVAEMRVREQAYVTALLPIVIAARTFDHPAIHADVTCSHSGILTYGDLRTAARLVADHIAREAADTAAMPEPETLGTTYDGVRVLKPATTSSRFTPEEVREAVRKVVGREEKNNG